MKMPFNVLGVKKFHGDIDGQKFDFTKLVVVMDMPDSNKNVRGQNAVELVYGDHTNFDQFEKLDFPCQIELDVNPTTKGLEVLSAKPIERKLQAAG